MSFEEHYEMTYADKVGEALHNMKIDEIFVISEKVKPENREIFVSVVKSYIDKNLGHNEGWEVIFSNDYSKVTKLIHMLK